MLLSKHELQCDIRLIHRRSCLPHCSCENGLLEAQPCSEVALRAGEPSAEHPTIIAAALTASSWVALGTKKPAEPQQSCAEVCSCREMLVVTAEGNCVQLLIGPAPVSADPGEER